MENMERKEMSSDEAWACADFLYQVHDLFFRAATKTEAEDEDGEMILLELSSILLEASFEMEDLALEKEEVTA